MVIYYLYRLNDLRISNDLIIAIILILYIIISVIFIHKDSLFTGAFINLFLGLAAYIYIRISKKYFKEKYYSRIFKYMIYITILLLIADTSYRLLNPNYFAKTSYMESRWFYFYKKNSLMFSDSNSTALIVLILYFTIVELNHLITHFKQKENKYINIILIILLFLTFSRAAYIAFISGLIYERYKGNIKRRNIAIYLILSIIILIIGICIFYNLYNTDLSFQSKFYIFEIAIKAFKAFSNYYKIVGIGFSDWQEILGIYTHNIFITYFIQTGIIGLVLFLSFLITIFRKSDYLLIPVIIVSLSFFSYLGTPFLFVPLAFICNIYDLELQRLQRAV